MTKIALIECVKMTKIALIEYYFFQSYTIVSNTDLYLSYNFWTTYYIVLSSFSAIVGKITPHKVTLTSIYALSAIVGKITPQYLTLTSI